MHKFKLISTLYAKTAITALAAYTYYKGRHDLAFVILLVYVLVDVLTMDKNKK